ARGFALCGFGLRLPRRALSHVLLAGAVGLVGFVQFAPAAGLALRRGLSGGEALGARGLLASRGVFLGGRTPLRRSLLTRRVRRLAGRVLLRCPALGVGTRGPGFLRRRVLAPRCLGPTLLGVLPGAAVVLRPIGGAALFLGEAAGRGLVGRVRGRGRLLV